MKIAAFLLLSISALWAQSSGTNPGPTVATTQSVSLDVQMLNDLLSRIQASAKKSDADIARLRIDKWKGESLAKQQSQATAASIRRNLQYAVPDLIQRIQAAPSSLSANFRLYRNMNALYDTFSTLTESARAFGPRDQYDPLAADLAQIDQFRKQVAEQVDALAGQNEAELARLRAQVAAKTTVAKPANKVVVVDDDQPKPGNKKKTTKSTQTTSQTPSK